MSSKIRKVRESVKKNVAYNQGYKCFECKNILPPSYQIDHIIPHSISADDNINNLQALCSNCHSNKSQREALRIQQYKTLVSKLQSNKHICWFCLEELTTLDVSSGANFEHVCDKICKDIELKLKKHNDLIISFSELCEKYKYNSINIQVNDERSFGVSLVKKLQELSLGVKCDLDDILRISLSKKYIYVKNYIYKNGDDFTIDDIVEAVTIATRTKRDSFKYIKVEIKLILNGTYDEKNNCVDYLSENIIDTFPERIFKKDVDIEYEFICI